MKAEKESDTGAQVRIKNVWKYNVEHEFMRISRLLDEGYCYVAMDTEFPGIVYNYPQDKGPEAGYRMLKQNVDTLKLIQMGITLGNAQGERPRDTHTWQFNLKFNLTEDRHNPDSISLLREAGIGFEELSEHGIDAMVFADLLMTSGLIVNPEVTWITFHGTYDFAYVLKTLLNEPLAPTADEFQRFMKHCFPRVYDIKTIVNDIEEWKLRSLSKLADDLSLKRHGQMHQAGSDALLTMEVFFAILKGVFSEGLPPKYLNRVFGFHSEGALLNYAEGGMGGYAPITFAYPQYPYFIPENMMMESIFAQSAIGNAYFPVPPRSGYQGR